MVKNHSRRQWMTKVASVGAIAALTASGATFAQSSWPDRTIRLIVPYAAGGATDIIGRALANGLQQRLGQPVIVENRTGASGTIGTDAVAKAEPDGYTFLLSLSTSMLLSKFLYSKLPYDPEKDLALISRIAAAPVVLAVHADLPVNTAPELLEYIKNNKGQLSYGSWGVGSPPHLGGDYMSQSMDANMVHVSYRGEAAVIQDLLAGRLQLSFISGLPAQAHVESGRIRLLGVTGEERLEILPTVPTFIEQGMTEEIYRLVGFMGFAAPAGTPDDIIQRMSREIVELSNQPTVQEAILMSGFRLTAGTPEAFRESYKRDAASWGALIESAGVRLD